MSNSSGDSTPGLEKLATYQSFKASPYNSLKVDSYFFTYEELLSQYRNRPIVFIEVGILSGGSLFMWRDYFGPEARIIGVEFNPAAQKWCEHGFEIFIGDQSDPEFWQKLFDKVGPVDIVLDDGGHTNKQQIITAMSCAPNIRDGGVLIIEDTHTSYFSDFGNPSKRSFISFAKRMVDGINGRYPRVPNLKNALLDFATSIQFYDSVVAFKIDRQRCFASRLINNGGESDSPTDFRYSGSWLQMVRNIEQFVMKYTPLIHRFRLVRLVMQSVFRGVYFIYYWIKSLQLRKFWR